LYAAVDEAQQKTAAQADALSGKVLNRLTYRLVLLTLLGAAALTCALLAYRFLAKRLGLVESDRKK